MKKSFVMVLLLSLLTSNIFANVKCKFNDDVWFKISKEILPDETIEEEFYRNRIPNNYIDAFLYHTADKREIRMNFYSIMVHESANFTAYINRNANGSIDYGPSQLNSKNIEDPWFMERFSPKDNTYIKTKYCRYMVITINFYYDLYKTWGDYAFYAYNGGPRAARLMKQHITSPQYESLLKNVKLYNKAVTRNVKKFTIDYNSFLYSRRLDHVISLINDYKNNIQPMVSLIDRNFNNRSTIHNIKKFISNSILYYIKREDLTELQNEEIVIEINSIIGKFQEKCG